MAIPEGATIVSAHLQFTAEEDDDQATTLLVRAEAVGHASRFRDEDRDLTSRTFTTNSVVWSPPAWRDDAAGSAQRTPDVAEVLQEVISRPDWRRGHAILFMLHGRGQRDAEAYDDDEPGRAPELVVTFNSTPLASP